MQLNIMGQEEGGQSIRQQSSIKFPYYDMLVALESVRSVRDRGAGACNYAQLAAWNGVSTTNGSFRVKYAAAQIYGFITVDKGTIELTDLGGNALEGTSRGPFVESFLNVDLFHQMYSQLEGRKLPPNEALETLANRLGVPVKQAKSARRAFVKSADFAGFIDSDTDILIKPVVKSQQGKDVDLPNTDELPSDSEAHHQDAGRYQRLDPTLLGLIDRLPDKGYAWEREKMQNWLRVFGEVLAFVYEEPMKDLEEGRTGSSVTMSILETGIPREIDNVTNEI